MFLRVCLRHRVSRFRKNSRTERKVVRGVMIAQAGKSISVVEWWFGMMCSHRVIDVVAVAAKAVRLRMP